MAEVRLFDGERIDDTGFGGLRVIQGSGFSYGVDAVLLAWFMAERMKPGRVVRVCDLGSGNGIIPLILTHKVPDCKVMGIELDSDAYSRAVRSAELNGLGDKVRFMNADIKDVYNSIMIEQVSGGESEAAGSFDAVITNPPYFRRGAAILNDADSKARARHEITAGLPEFLALAEKLLRPGGDFFMIHRPDRLVDIFSEMRECRIEPKEMQLVTPRAGEAANLVLIHGIKGAGPELRLLPEMAVHGEGQEYTPWIDEVYERKQF